MISIFLAETDRLDSSSPAEKAKKERVGASALLSFAIRSLTDRDPESLTVTRDEYGKPGLAEPDGTPAPLFFNTSHSGGIVAVAFSDEGEVGVDLEPQTPPDRAERLSRRLSESLPPEDLEVVPFRYTVAQLLSDDGVSDGALREITVSAPPHPLGFTSRWTLMEAVMKCDGRGFAAIADVTELYHTHDVSTAFFDIGDERYYLSVATKK